MRSAGRTTGITFVLALALYTATAAPTVYNLDSAEFTTAAATGGIIRATGYPLYLAIGRAWSQLPIGDVGFRLNLLSAVAGAATLALAAWLLRRAGVSGWAIFGGLGLLATGRYFWAMSVIAEVYSLHTFMMLIVLAALIAWRQDPQPWRLALAAAATGLSYGNHVATVLLLPAIAAFVLWPVEGRLRYPDLRTWAAGLGGGLLGLSIYAYLPWLQRSDPAFNYAGAYAADGSFEPVDLSTLSGLWWLVSGRSFSHVVFGYTPGEMVGELGHFMAEWVRAFLAVGIGPGLLGAVLLWRFDRRLAVTLGLMFAATAVFYSGYRVIDKDTMFLPSYVVWALAAAVGYEALIRLTSGHRVEAVALRAVIVMSVVAALLWNWRSVDLSDDWSARRRAESVLEHLEDDALLIGWWSTVPVVQYLQLVEDERPDVLAVNRFLVAPPELRRMVWREMARRPVYLDEPPGRLFPRLEGYRSGPVFRLARQENERLERSRETRASLWLR